MSGTRVWGPIVWKILHIGAALKYPPRFYKMVTMMIPCPVCLSHYNRNMKSPDATKLINFHSMVNAYHVKPRRAQMSPPEGGWIEYYKRFRREDIIHELENLRRKVPNLRQQIEAVKREIKSYK